MDILLILFTYVFVINVVAFGLYAIDKHRAYFEEWRISEALLLGVAVLGGAYGAGVGMMLFRHKTLHKAFLITVPLFFIIWMAMLLFLCRMAALG